MFPFGRPRCEQRITLAPSSMARLMVGRVERMRVSSVIWCESSNGTLKSARMMTRLSRSTTSSIVCLRSLIAAPSGRSFQEWASAWNRTGLKQASTRGTQRPVALAAMTLMRSRTRHEYPHSLSYQAVTLTSRLSMAIVSGASNVAE